MNASIPDLLHNSRRIAVVGLSPNPERVSHAVARYLQMAGYQIIPINPTVALGTRILGQLCYPTAMQAAQVAAIDLVNVFRKSEDIAAVWQDVAAARVQQSGISALWLQLGISHPESEESARLSGLQFVSNRCIKIEHQRLLLPFA